MRWSRAYEDCDDVPPKPRDGLVWWSPPVESSCEAQVEELHWTERLVTGKRSGMPYVLQHVERAGLVELQHANVAAWDARLRVRAALRTREVRLSRSDPVAESLMLCLSSLYRC